MSNDEQGKSGNVILTQQYDCNKVAEESPALRIRAGLGWGKAPGGAIIFELPDGSEAFRLNDDGTIFEKGEKVADDRAMYEALRRWLATSETHYPSYDGK